MPTHPLCLLSLRQRNPYPAQGCVNEMEDVFAQAGFPVCAPTANENWLEAIDRAGVQAPRLLISAVSIAEVVQLLRQAPGWRRRFDAVHAYVYDCWPAPWQKTMSPLRKRVSGWFRAARQIDGLFVPSPAAAPVMSQCFGPKAHYVPMAADVLRFGCADDERPISVNGYGRQHPAHIEILSREYNRIGSGRMLHHTDHMVIGSVPNLAAHRAWFWKLLSLSQLAMAYDLPRVDPGGRRFPFSMIGQRWFESLVAGCVVVGFRPQCPEANELLHWRDATLECPDDAHAFHAFVEDLLREPARLAQMRRTNVAQMALTNDWGHRIADMLRALQLPVPDALTQRLATLRERAAQIQRG